MKLSDIKLIDHPKGREAMVGWMVKVPEGIGVIRQFIVKTEPKVQAHWLIVVEFCYPREKIHEPMGYREDEIEIVGTGAPPNDGHSIKPTKKKGKAKS